jgi:starch synthase
MWPDTFEDWYRPLGVDRERYLADYDQEWIISVARALGEAGAEVHIVFGTLEAAQVAEQRASGATVHFVRAALAYRALRFGVWGHRHYRRVVRLWAAAPLASTASLRLLRALRAIAPDVVVVQDYEPLRYDVAALLLPLAGLPFVGADTGGSARPSRAPWKRWTARRARALLALYAAEARRLERDRRPRRVGVWPIPVRTDLYAPADRAAARARLGISADARIVLSVGRLHEVKGLHDLAAACRPLDCELVLVGSGPEEASLRARGDVRLTGNLPAEEVCAWYAAADVVALASRQEGQPVAVIEALACARGVVATRVGGVPEVIADGVTGWLVAPRDVDALREALRDALADRDEADRRGAAGRAAVASSCSCSPAKAPAPRSAARPARGAPRSPGR